MNFKIVENPEPDYNIEEIIQDYQNLDLTVKEIREKHGIGKSRWDKNILNQIRERGVPLRDRRTFSKVERRRIKLDKTK